MGDILTFVFTGLLFLVLFWVQNKAKGKLEEQEEEKTMPKEKVAFKPPSPSFQVKEKKASYTPRAIPIYEVTRKKKASFLSKALSNKDKIKQAFVLSEILKRKDEP
ncbi:MAG: hypothetical protein JSS09_06265 [Verrucomicrobia bacterium]|nr:hypothetical protein [Verrucomicrobiota bacterium]